MHRIIKILSAQIYRNTAILMPAILIGCQGKSNDTGWWNCENAEDVTYDNFGASFLRHNCQGCHATTTANRYGAPENVHFDDEGAVMQWRERILATTLSDPPSMPPAGAVTDEQAILLHWWLECGESQ